MNFKNGYLVADSYTTNMFNIYINVTLLKGFFQRTFHCLTTAGHTTGAQSDPHFALQNLVLYERCLISLVMCLCTTFPAEKICQYFFRLFNTYMSIGNIINLHNRCQCATSQAGYFLNGKQPVLISFFIIF